MCTQRDDSCQERTGSLHAHIRLCKVVKLVNPETSKLTSSSTPPVAVARLVVVDRLGVRNQKESSFDRGGGHSPPGLLLLYFSCSS